jgi:hypothetical protein
MSTAIHAALAPLVAEYTAAIEAGKRRSELLDLASRIAALREQLPNTLAAPAPVACNSFAGGFKAKRCRQGRFAGEDCGGDCQECDSYR